MYPNPPGLIRIYNKPNRTPWVIGGILASAITVYGAYNFWSNRVAESNIPKTQWEAAQAQPVKKTIYAPVVERTTAKPVRKTIPVTIPKDKLRIVRERVAELRRLKVREETIEGLITTFEIENPDWNHRAVGGCGERGYGQNLEPVVEDTVENALANPNGNRTNSALAHYILPLVRNFSIQTRKDYINGGWLSKKLARRKIRNYVYKRLIQDEHADWDISVAVYLHDTIGARNICTDYHVPFSPSVTDTYHNAPKRTKDALRHCGVNFLQCTILPKITKRRLYTHRYVPRELLRQPIVRAKH
jgi:hypothetical protein